MSDWVSTTKAREEGLNRVILGQNLPEIVYCEHSESWLAGGPRPWQAEAVVVVSGRSREIMNRLRRACLIGLGTLASCAPPAVWVKPGATEADFQVSKGRCLAAAYAQVPAAPAVATVGSGYQAPTVTNCSAFGNFANCTTTGGQYTPPVSVPYDANAGVRRQVYNGCMYSEGWSLERQGEVHATAESDWTKGLNWGVSHHESSACEGPPAGIANGSDWSLGCHSGQKAARGGT